MADHPTHVIWPIATTLSTGDVLVMEGNLTSDTHPFSVVWTRDNRPVRELKYETHAIGKEAFYEVVEADCQRQKGGN